MSSFSTPVGLVYTDTFENLLNHLVDYLTPFSSQERVVTRALNVIERFEKRVLVAPYSVPVSHYLLSIGVNSFREFNADGFKILYRVFDDGQGTRIVVDTITSQKQDIEQVLVNYCLLYK
ncbi:MAG: type II toxin-antitoxin system RelE/ParE family toxin [Algicola sp.]|nr:type II toxin-antitoxin system RelE/ParE family toxin [Algicola sp.]